MSKPAMQSYPAALKERAVKLAVESDQSIAQTARDLGVNENTLHTWIGQYHRVERQGTGSVSCNSVFVRHLGRFLNQEDLMEPEATVQNPQSHCRDLTCCKMHPDKIMHNPVHI